MSDQLPPKKFHLVVFSSLDRQKDREDYALLTSRIKKLVPNSVKLADNVVLLPDGEFIKAEEAVIGILRDSAEFLKFEVNPVVTGIYANELKTSLLRLGFDAYSTPSSAAG